MRGLYVPAALLLLAELAARWFGVRSDSLAAPSQAVAALWSAMSDGVLLIWTAQTLGAALAGLALGVMFGLLVAALVGLSPVAARVLWLPIEFLRPIPSVALLPVALLVFGFGFRLEISIVAFACFWPMVIVGGSAIGQVEPRLLEVARVLRMGWPARVGKIVLPAALPRLFVAARLAAGVALIVAVTVEIALNPLGLGFAMIEAQQTMRPALMFAVLIWVGVLGWGLNWLLLMAQRCLFGRAAVVIGP